MCYYVVLFLFYLSSHCHEYNFIPQTPLKRATEAHHQQSFGAFLFCDRITNYLCTINVLNSLIILLHVLFGGSLLVLYLTMLSWKRIHFSNIIWRKTILLFKWCLINEYVSMMAWLNRELKENHQTTHVIMW